MAYRSVEELQKKANKGDAEAAWELFRRASSGDRAAQAAVVRNLTGSEECDEVAQHREELAALVKLVDSNPRKALPAVEQALREPHGACYRVQVLGARAHIERILGDLEAAERTLAEAWHLARHCPVSEPDLLRRESRLLEAQGRYQEALEKAEAALGLYRAMDGPGHDPDGNGIANCLYRLGQIKDVCFGDVAGAIADFSECVSVIKLGEAPELYDYALRSLAYELSLTGDPGLEEKALEMIGDARRRYHGVQDPSLPRSKLDWMEAQMRWNLGDRRDRAKDLFLRAQGDFIDPLGCREEAMGVTADIFLAHLRDREFLLDHLEKMHSAFQELINGTKLRAAWAAFNAVKKAARSTFSWETEELRRSIAALRDSVSHAPGVLRCILRVG